MTEHGAERAITVSALIVAGIYAYRRLTEGTGPPAKGSKLKQLAGQGSPASVGVFITAWGFTFLGVSIMAAISPGLGGSMAILIATSDALTNLDQVSKDVNTKLTTTAKAGVGSSSTSVTAAGVTAAGLPAPTSILTPNPPAGVILK